jgi:hypothetical protein
VSFHKSKKQILRNSPSPSLELQWLFIPGHDGVLGKVGVGGQPYCYLTSEDSSCSSVAKQGGLIELHVKLALLPKVICKI